MFNDPQDFSELSPLSSRHPADAETLADALYLTLTSAPTSAEMARLVEALERDIHALSGRARRSKKLTAAIGALLADLMRFPERHFYRPLNPAGFGDCPIGYEPCRDVIRGMEALGYLDVFTGFRRNGPLIQSQMATRIRLRPEFLEYAEGFGVCSAWWADHFIAAPIGSYNPDPVQLREQATRSATYKRLSGKRLAVSPEDATVIKMGKRVNRINALRPSFTLGAIENVKGKGPTPRLNHEVHQLFFRSFTKLRGERNRWNKSGRLYSQGRYQQFSKKDRSTITIDGEATVEIDISACHLTIVYARNGMKLDAFAAYTIDGFPRAVIKSWVTMTLGHSKFHRAWPKATVDRMLDKSNGEINLRDYPIKDVEAAVLAKHPLLKEWPSSPIRWGDLQYKESKVMVDTVYTLAVKHCIPALPVHDSIIVPASKIEIAKDMLIATFEKHIGVKPMLKTD